MIDLAQFRDPLWLLLLAALPWLARRHHAAPAAALTYSRLPAGAEGGRWRLHLPFYLRLAALGLLVVALARPQLGYAWEESTTEGIDIQIVLDISGSMGAEDFQPRNRLEVAKDVVREFIRGRPSDRIGAIVFSGTALTRSPLTVDRRMLELMIDSVELNSLPDGTAIGVALASAAARLADAEARSRVIVLVTDGVNNAGAIDPMAAAAVCEGLGIRVYTVGVGTRGRVPVPVPVDNPVTGRREIRRVPMNVQVDEALLERVAERTSGQFYRARDRDSLRQIFSEIDRLETTPLTVRRYVRYRDTYPPLVWLALGLVLLPVGLAAPGWTVEP